MSEFVCDVTTAGGNRMRFASGWLIVLAVAGIWGCSKSPEEATTATSVPGVVVASPKSLSEIKAEIDANKQMPSEMKERLKAQAEQSRKQ